MVDARTWLLNLPPGQRAVWRQVAASVPDFHEFTRDRIEQSIPDRFEHLARVQPGRLAVSDANGELSYDQLNAQANRVARAIISQASAKQEPVGILLEKRCSFIAACLGALKADKLFVPLDPSLPEARLAYILQDTEPGVIVTNDANAPLARGLGPGVVSVVNLDELDLGVETDDLGLSIPLEHLTWILYTSGSTGQPKGVVQNHRNVLHYVMNYANYFCISPNDRLTLLFSPSVNQAAHDIFASLLTGASIHLFDIRSQGLARLAEWLNQREITIYYSAPTVFSHLIDNLHGDETFSKVRLVRLNGEPVYRRHVELFKRHFESHCVFVNRLGSTETGSILFYFIKKGTEIEGSLVPMGHPVEGNEVVLLGEDGRELQSGGVGEIVVKSSYLSPGYWKRPELTEKAFVDGGDGGVTRIYRMGDLGYKVDSGAFVHAGRTDFQVKVRGHRIELGEIEASLLSLDSVRDGVVVARQEPSGDHHLVAYVMPVRKPGPSVSEIRRRLSAQLPEVMVPSRFVLLDALPQAPNGKIDRQSLPDPAPVRPDLDVAFVAPRTYVEESLAAILADLLNYEEIGVHDDFLDLGGNSLLAARFISRVIDTFRVELPLAELFEAPTVAQMAKVVTRNLARTADPEEIERMLSELESMSDADAADRVNAELAKSSESTDGRS